MSNLVIREATLADNDALVDLERRSPIVLGIKRLVFDRSPNFFARRELQENGCVLVAERDGCLAGVMAAAWYETLVGGERLRVLYVHHGRVPVEYQRSGVMSALGYSLLERCSQYADLLYWYVLPENDTSLGIVGKVSPKPWHRSPASQRFLLDAERSTGDEPPPARPEQADDIAELINKTHSGRDLFLPYTAERLAARLSRSAGYGWPQLYVRERDARAVAVAGLWDLGATLRVVEVDETGTETASRPAVVLDYGCADGAESEMAALLDELGRLAAARGRQELWISLDPVSKLYHSVRGRPHVGETLVAFNVTPDAPLPGRLAAPYLDFVYW